MSVYTVAAHQSRVDAVFARAAAVTDLQTQADMSRYLCVLVSGFMEQATRHIYGEYARTRSSPQVTRYVERQLEGFMNANTAKLCQITGAFDGKWRQDLEDYLAGQRKDALDSIIANRHQIAHGRDVSLTYVRMKDYYDAVKDVIAYLEAQCA
jgi:HEPN superfamily RiboL-PSP-like protein